MINSKVKYHLLSGFEDPKITPTLWNQLLAEGSSDVIFMTWHWQKVWWEVFGRGELLIVLAEKDGSPLAIAPLFTGEGMIYFVGSGGSDYLDFIGNIDDAILEGLLLTAINQVPNFIGFIFYHILENSNTLAVLNNIAKRLSWRCTDEGIMESPMLWFKQFPQQGFEATRKKSLLRHESWFERNGGFQTEHLTKAEEILPYLNSFFEQHIARWKVTDYPSLFLQSLQCEFYKRLSFLLSETGWLRFTRVMWQGVAVAYHFGFHYSGNFFWYKPSFDIALAKHSPGEVLLRQLLIRAQEEKARLFDFGLGDEPFKKRFATNTRFVKNRGLYKPVSDKEIKNEKSFSYQSTSG